MQKTKLDLYRSAETAALKTLDLKTAHAIATAALEAFAAEKFEPADYDFWKQSFDQQRATFLQLRMEKAVSKPVK